MKKYKAAITGDIRMEIRHRKRVLIADDHILFAQACKGLLEPEFEVVGIVADGRSLVRTAAELRPDVVIVDISMPELNGLDAGEQIKKKDQTIKLVYLTMNTDAEIAADAYRRGASGYLLKHCTAEELVKAVRRVLQNESYLCTLMTKETVESLLQAATANGDRGTTGRQTEVLQLFAEGKSMKQIAHILQLNVSTVSFHKYKMMQFLGLKSNAELIKYALQRHMIS